MWPARCEEAGDQRPADRVWAGAVRDAGEEVKLTDARAHARFFASDELQKRGACTAEGSLSHTFT